MDTVSMIIEYEMGELNDIQTLHLFKELIKSGMAWQLQGHYGRTASALIDDGWLTKDGNYTEKTEDFINEN